MKGATTIIFFEDKGAKTCVCERDGTVFNISCSVIDYLILSNDDVGY